MNVVMTGGGRFVEVQATAEGRPYTAHELEQMLEIAAAGIERLKQLQIELLHMKFGGQNR
jgi:ribonuclease PH